MRLLLVLLAALALATPALAAKDDTYVAYLNGTNLADLGTIASLNSVPVTAVRRRRCCPTLHTHMFQQPLGAGALFWFRVLKLRVPVCRPCSAPPSSPSPTSGLASSAGPPTSEVRAAPRRGCQLFACPLPPLAVDMSACRLTPCVRPPLPCRCAHQRQQLGAVLRQRHQQRQPSAPAGPHRQVHRPRRLHPLWPCVSAPDSPPALVRLTCKHASHSMCQCVNHV